MAMTTNLNDMLSETAQGQSFNIVAFFQVMAMGGVNARGDATQGASQLGQADSSLRARYDDVYSMADYLANTNANGIPQNDTGNLLAAQANNAMSHFKGPVATSANQTPNAANTEYAASPSLWMGDDFKAQQWVWIFAPWFGYASPTSITDIKFG